jgi:hypothetical protein
MLTQQESETTKPPTAEFAPPPAFGTAKASPIGFAPPPPFGTTQPPPFGFAPPPPFGTTQPQPFGFAPPPAFGTTQPQPFGFAPPPAFGTTQPQPFGYAPPPPFGTTQQPLFGSFSPRDSPTRSSVIDRLWQQHCASTFGVCALCPQCGGSSMSTCRCAQKRFESNAQTYARTAVADLERQIYALDQQRTALALRVAEYRQLL